MSLKYDRVEWLLSHQDIAYAVEELKNGKRNAKRELYKFVAYRRMSKQEYKEIVKRYNKVNINKNKRRVYLFGYPIEEYTPVLSFFVHIVAVCIILSYIGEQNVWTTGTALFLIISYFVYHTTTEADKKDKDHEIAKLKQENKILEEALEETKEAYKIEIRLLENEIKKNFGSQQN